MSCDELWRARHESEQIYVHIYDLQNGNYFFKRRCMGEPNGCKQ